jgi:hypothetical protein
MVEVDIPDSDGPFKLMVDKSLLESIKKTNCSPSKSQNKNDKNKKTKRRRNRY